MFIRRQLVVSVAAAAALLASAATPVPNFGTAANAQQADGKGPGSANRPNAPGKAGSSVRPNPPTINRTPAGVPKASPERSSQQRTIRREGAGIPNRVVIRDGDRRRGDGDRRRGTRHNWAPGFTFYFYDGFYHGDCSWLRRKVRETGSSYWRQRLRQCRDQ